MFLTMCFFDSRKEQQQKRKNRYAVIMLQCIIVLFVLETLVVYLLNDVTRGVEEMLQKVEFMRSDLIAGDINILASKCRNQPTWIRDPIWRNAILRPKICTTTKNRTITMNEQLYQQEQLALLHQTFFTSNAEYTPCGANCVFHLDSAYSYQYGHPVHGWLLRENEIKDTGRVPNSSADEESNKNECWEPFNSQVDDSPCLIHRYDNWIDYVEEAELKQRKLPNFNQQSSIRNKNFNFKIIHEQMEKYQPKCRNDNAAPLGRFTSSSASPFCHYRSYDGSSTNSRGIDDESGIKSPNNLKPSEVVDMFDRDQLGIGELSDALISMNETFKYLNVSSCNAEGQPEQSMLCVYHRHSIPSTVNGSAHNGAKITIKGWLFRTLDKCFIPISNMEYSFTCGRKSDPFNVWTRYMADQQHGKQLEGSFLN